MPLTPLDITLLESIEKRLEDPTMKAKGIPKSALARQNFDDYFAMCVQAHEEDVEFRHGVLHRGDHLINL